MAYVSYNYFETPKEETIYSIASAFFQPGFEVSNAGKNDPPKRFNGDVDELCNLIKDGNELTNYTFIRFHKTKVEVTIEIHNDPRWEHSTFSIAGPEKNTVEKLCISFNDHINSFLCISGVLGHGSNQKWTLLHKSRACPQSLMELASNA